MGSPVTIFENSAAHINIITVHQCIRLSLIYSTQPNPPLVALAWDKHKGGVGNHISYDKGTNIKRPQFFFYCCTVHFDNLKILVTNKCTPLLNK